MEMMNNSSSKREYIVESLSKYFHRGEKPIITYEKLLLRGWDNG